MAINGTTPVAEAEVIPPGAGPRGLGDAGTAYPIDRVPTGCVIVRREVVWALGGVFVGGLLMFWALRELKNR